MQQRRKGINAVRFSTIIIKFRENNRSKVCLSVIFEYHTNILWKENFNSDGHQFYQYQQNSHLKSLSVKKTTRDVDNAGSGFGGIAIYYFIKTSVILCERY